MIANGNGWKVAIFLGGWLLGGVMSGGIAYVHVAAAETRCMSRNETLKGDVQGELKEHGLLLQEIDRRLARIEGSLAKDNR